MKLKLAVCDDDAGQRSHLEEMVQIWAGESRHLVRMRQYADARSFLFDYCEEKDFDILLLDIEMPGMNGIELAKEVRRGNAAVQIVFITGYYEYFGDGFDVSALHYLIKPVDGGKLRSVLDRAAENLAFRQRCVLLPAAEGDVRISLADILYVEAQNVHIIVHTTRGNYRARMPLARLSGELDETFFKVHRSFIVSLKYVRKITRTGVAMEGGDAVPISRGMYNAVHAALIRYL